VWPGLDRVLESVQLFNLSGRLDGLTDDADVPGLLTEIATTLPVAAQTLDRPFFALVPTTFEPRARWPELVAEYGFAEDVLTRLFEAGFVVLDRESPEFGFLGDPFSPSVTSRYLLADPDYAAVLLPHPGGPPGNANLAPLVHARYAEHYPIVGREPSALYSIGAIRGQLAFNGVETEAFTPVQVTVSSRAQLDEILARIQANLADRPELTVWLRGQTCEYLTGDLTSDAERGICPWRSLRDPSLVPSLCRHLSALGGGWRDYASALIDWGWYATFIDTEFDVPVSEARDPLDRPRERLGDEWAAVEFTSTRSTGEVRDYHRVFRSVQKLFFFQHYGLPSPVLDITKDPDVALFFANHRIEDGRYVSVGPDPARVMYVLILQEGLDQFLDSRQVSEQYRLLRPLRQACGLIAGASMVNRNAYARYISVRIRLDGDIGHQALEPSYLFPHADEDAFLERLLEFQHRRGLKLGPFALARPGRPKRPEVRPQDVVDAYNRGVLLHSEGDADAAIEAFRRADAWGSVDAPHNLGVLLEQRGDIADAEAAYRRAAERGSEAGTNNLGTLLRERGDVEGAISAFCRADEMGSAVGAFNLGVLLAAEDDLEGAESAFGRADERGSDMGAYNLGVLLAIRGDLAGAEAVYARAAGRGHGEAMNRLLHMQAERGDIDAQDLLRRLEARRANLGL
jgi:Flp pilus assembly protein TadD